MIIFSNEVLNYVFLPWAWDIEFFDQENKEVWHSQYANDLVLLRKAYPELNAWTDLQLVISYEEYSYQLYRHLTFTPHRNAEFLGYLYLYQETHVKPDQQQLNNVKSKLITLWESFSSGKIID
jgi:hypothetical protein